MEMSQDQVEENPVNLGHAKQDKGSMIFFLKSAKINTMWVDQFKEINNFQRLI